MLEFFLNYSYLCQRILFYFGIDITLFNDFERLLIIILCHILALLFFWFILGFFYKIFCRLFGLV